MGRPTHTVHVSKKNQPRSYNREVGVAWGNERGWISVQLYPGTCLTDRDDLWINIYPKKWPDTKITDYQSADVGDPPDYMNEGPPLEDVR